MSRNSFVPEYRSRLFDRCANVKILRLWIVSRNEIKTGWVFVVNARWIHKTSGAGRLKRIVQLPNLKPAEIIGQRDQMVFLQEIDNLLFATLVRFQERRLIGRNVRAACRIG